MAGFLKGRTEQAVEVHVVAAFAFAPEGFAALGGEGGAVGPGAAVDVGGGQVEAEGGFADAGLAGKNAVCLFRYSKSKKSAIYPCFERS